MTTVKIIPFHGKSLEKIDRESNYLLEQYLLVVKINLSPFKIFAMTSTPRGKRKPRGLWWSIRRPKLLPRSALKL